MINGKHSIMYSLFIIQIFNNMKKHWNGKRIEFIYNVDVECILYLCQIFFVLDGWDVFTSKFLEYEVTR
jgi:hypothetical protein